MICPPLWRRFLYICDYTFSQSSSGLQLQGVTGERTVGFGRRRLHNLFVLKSAVVLRQQEPVRAALVTPVHPPVAFSATPIATYCFSVQHRLDLRILLKPPYVSRILSGSGGSPSSSVMSQACYLWELWFIARSSMDFFMWTVQSKGKKTAYTSGHDWFTFKRIC